MPIRARHRLRTLLRLGRRGRRGSVRLALTAGLFLTGLVGIEHTGRALATDAGDALMLVALGGLLLVCTLLGGRRITPWIERGKAGAGRAVAVAKAGWPQFGVSFREDPSIPQRLPPIVRIAAAALALGAGLVIGWTAWAPTSLRAWLAPRLYLLHLAILLVVWAGLVIALLLGIVLAWMVARHILWIGGRDSGRARRMLAVWLGVLLCAGLLLPVEVAMVVGVVALVLALATTRLARLPHLAFLWRTDADGQVAAISFSGLYGQMTALPMAAFLLLLAMALGGTWSWWPTAPSSTPLTDTLARLAAWTLGGGFLVHAIAVFVELRRLASSDPSVPCPTMLHVTVATTGEGRDRRVIERLFAARGWRVRYPPADPDPTDVRLRLVDPPMPRPLRGWPLCVSPRALEVPELLDLLARRDVVQRRRLLRRGLQRLLKEVRVREFERGEGFWIAPHLRIASGVTRDTEEEDLSEDGIHHELGTPYARLFPLPAREHFHVVLRTVEVDIILLEDGVRWSAFRRVLDRIFAHHDEGRGRIEERDFTGIVGVRVILHDLAPGGRLGVEGYPEPDYTDLARARILHVFKDRGGLEDEPEPVPAEDTGVLVRC